MRKNILSAARLILAGSICSLSLVTPAQMFSRLDASTLQNSNNELIKPARIRALKKVLFELESRFKVNFAFDERLINKIQVSSDLNGENLDEILEILLTNYNLKFKKIKDNLYVIQDNAVKPKKTSNIDSKTENLNKQLIARTITGKIVDENGQGIPGVTVLLKGTTVGASSDGDGNYSISIPDDGGILVISSIGYSTKEVIVRNQDVVNISLTADVKTLNEVVVTGYQSQKRADITGAVGVVDVKEMQKVQASEAGQMIQGRVAGVTVTSGGAPGQASSIKIRGTSSVNGNDGPLYVIDGMFQDGIYADYNPNDIETIQVLKDAASCALYGSRGQNGVIVITTKKGKTGAPKVEYSTYTGIQNIYKKLPLMNSTQYKEVNDLAYKNAGLTPLNFNKDKNGNLVNTDWQGSVFKPGVITNHTLTFSGATEKSNYLVSANYFFQDGTIKGPDFRRYQVRVNTEMKRGIITFGERIMLSRNITTNVNGSPFTQVIRMLPTIPVYDSTTTSGYGYGNQGNNTFGTNPIAQQFRYNNKTISSKVFGTVYGELQLLPFLKYKINLGLDYSQQNQNYYQKAGAISQNSPDGVNFVEDTWTENFNFLVENTLNFNKTFGKHNIAALVGYTAQNNNQKQLFAHTEGINGEYWSQNNGTSSPRTGGYTNVGTLRSFLASVNYAFDDKYLVQVNMRRDGSSNFREDIRWGTFPSVSVGWRLSKESFLQDVSAITDLKLRASYGTVGNQGVPAYVYQSVIDYNLNYVLGGNVVPGASNRTIRTPGLKWESKTTTNFGIDLALLNNKILLSTDYFIANTKDVILQVPVPFSFGNQGDNPFQNLGQIQNKGIEAALTYQDQKGEFKYSANLNFAALRNKVIQLVDVNNNQPIYGFGSFSRLAVGEAAGSFYGYKTDGIFQNQAEVDASPQKNRVAGGLKPGDVRIVDQNNDGKIDFEHDRVVLGTPFPKFEYGLNLAGSWRGFDLTLYFFGVNGNKIYNAGRVLTERYDDNANYRTDSQYWHGEGTSNSVPRPLYGDSRNVLDLSDRWIEKGDYFRLKNLQIGYTINASLLQRVKAISSLRVYVTGQNVFTATKYKGYNPEVTGADGSNSVFNRGIDNGNYPTLRTFSFGLTAGF